MIAPFKEEPPSASGGPYVDQGYAILYNAPAINIDQFNRASIVTWNGGVDRTHVNEAVVVWNAFGGSAQVITNGVPTIPDYAGSPPLHLKSINGYGVGNSWYDLITSRTIMGINSAGTHLYIFTADFQSGSLGMKISELVDFALSSSNIYNAINCDGGGSTQLAVLSPLTSPGSVGSLINYVKDGPRSCAANLAIVTPQWPSGSLPLGTPIITATQQ